MINYEIKINEEEAFKKAKYLCENYHYSKTTPPSKFYFTVYELGELVGVITFGNGANMNGAKQFNLTQKEALELTRCAFKEHKNFLSLYISKALKHLKREKIKLVYSYSDLRQSHFGTLYKAANFKFVAERKLTGDEIYNDKKQRGEHQRNYGKDYKKEKEQNINMSGKDFLIIKNYKTRKQSNKMLGVKIL